MNWERERERETLSWMNLWRKKYFWERGEKEKERNSKILLEGMNLIRKIFCALFLTVSAVTCVSSLPPTTSVLNSSVSMTVEYFNSVPRPNVSSNWWIPVTHELPSSQKLYFSNPTSYLFFSQIVTCTYRKIMFQ